MADVILLFAAAAAGFAFTAWFIRHEREREAVLDSRLAEVYEYRDKYLIALEAGQGLYLHLLDRLGEDDVEAWPAVHGWERVAPRTLRQLTEELDLPPVSGEADR